MPAIYASLVKSRGLTPHVAWRVAYIVPFIIITLVVLGMLFTCDDAPTGKWSTWTKEHRFGNDTSGSNVMDLSSGSPSDRPSAKDYPADVEQRNISQSQFPDQLASDSEGTAQANFDKANTIAAFSYKDTMGIVFSPSTIAVAIPYGCTFGAELAINSILGHYYAANFPRMGQTQSGQWAAMFGLLNVVCRPVGGYIADLLYRSTGTVWSKKILLSFLGVSTGVFQLVIGLLNPEFDATMLGLTAGLAFFLEAGNGANFAIVPHVYPCANGKFLLSLSLSLSLCVQCPAMKQKLLKKAVPNVCLPGVVSGVVGGMGNFGGVIFAIIFRYNGTNFALSLWVIGVISIAATFAVSWIRPVSGRET
jgi:NNP family nitrate/nitrite transporter-like MFS transporter